MTIVAAIILLFAASCNTNDESKNKEDMSKNPLLVEFDTPFGVPPFDKIKNKHFLPAFKEAMAQHNQEIEEIIKNPDAPNFKNTVEALDFSGELLNNVEMIFDGIKEPHTNDSLNAISKEISPLLSKHRDEIYLNQDLFKRVKEVYDNRDKENLSGEEAMLLDKTYKGFVRNGANLPEEKRNRLKEINKKLSALSIEFGDNVLSETNDFKLVIDKEEDLDGLPENVIHTAQETAESKGEKGKWVFTLAKPSMIPFLTYAKNRSLREKIYKAYINRANNDNANDNKNVIKEIINLRIEKAKLLGYENYAAYIIEKNMAATPENVFQLLNETWEATLPVVKKEAEELQKMIDKEGGKFKLASWDWWYYSEKLRKEKYSLDEEALRPYFTLENTYKGVFLMAQKLFGITFTPLKDFPVYHPEVTAYEVKEADGTHLAIYYVDSYPRDSKRSGAWMTSFRKQSRIKGKDISPVIINVTNVSRPAGNKPALLSVDEVETVFHEFGHALHGMLSNCKYFSLSGTSVPRDFVEFPSQVIENWAFEPELLKQYAFHYETGEVIPDSLIQKLKNSSKFNNGFATAEYTAAALLDMNWHTLKEPVADLDVNQFENKILSGVGLIPEVISRYRTTYFQHIFSGGYAAGYYVYQWSQVLDADAFEAFKETSLFDKETAKKYRENILAKGNTDDPMNLYKAFRGREPKADAFLKRLGFTNK